MKPAGRWTTFSIYRLDSGIDLFVQPTDRFKKVNLRAFARTPLGTRTSETALLPHVLSRGTRKHPSMARITTHLDNLYGASASADAWKLGENHVLAFHVDLVADRFLPGRTRNVRDGLEFLRAMMAEPVLEGKTLRADYVDQERHNQKRAIEDMMSDRAEYAAHRCIEEMCRGEAYAENERGSLAGLDALTVEGLTGWHRAVIEEAPLEIYVSGRVDPDEVADLANATFRFKGRKAARAVPETVVDVPVKEPRRVVERMDIEQGKLVMGFRTYTTYRDSDSTALAFMDGIFGAYPHSRLFLNVREKEGLAYSAGSSTDRMKGIMTVHAGIDFEKFEKCLAVIGEEFASIQAGKISDEEMEATRKAMTESVRGSLDSPSWLISSLFRRRVAGRLQTVDEALAEIAAITKEDVVKVAGKVKLDTVYWLTRVDA